MARAKFVALIIGSVVALVLAFGALANVGRKSGGGGTGADKPAVAVTDVDLSAEGIIF